jgi:hypothetical protein
MKIGLFDKLKKMIEDGKPAYSIEIKPTISENYKPRVEGTSDLQSLGALFLKSLEYTGTFLVYKDKTLVPTCFHRDGIEKKTAILDISEPSNRIAILRGESVCAKYSDGKVFSYNKDRIIA